MNKGLFIVFVALLLYGTTVTVAYSENLQLDIMSNYEGCWDLNDDGINDVEVTMKNSHSLLLFSGEDMVYRKVGAEIGQFRKMFIEDFDNNGIREIMIVEVWEDENIRIIQFLLYGVIDGTAQELDSLVYNTEKDFELSSQLIKETDLMGDGTKQILFLCRDSSVEPSVIDEYRLLTVQDGKIYETFTKDHAKNLVDLDIGVFEKGAKVREKRCVFNQTGEPSGIVKDYLLWDGTGFETVYSQTVPTYYLEEPNIDTLVGEASRLQGIPEEILWAVMLQESNAEQFDFGEPKVSGDGGIGIMQVTPINEKVTINNLGITYEEEEIERLKYDTAFNLRVGAQVLYDKWLTSFGYYATLPRVGMTNPEDLESWYFALWAYNGYCMKNYPQLEWGDVYQEQVIDRVSRFNKSAFSSLEFGIWDPAGKLICEGKGFPVEETTQGTLSRLYPGDTLGILPKLTTLSLRSDAALLSNVLGTLGEGSRLRVKPYDSSEWVKVVVDNDTLGNLTGEEGYVHRDYVELQSSVESDAVVTTNMVRLREKPYKPSNLIAKLERGDKIEILCESTYNIYAWYEVKVISSKNSSLVGSTGYVAALPACGFSADENYQAGDSLVIEADLNLRSYPSIFETSVNVVADLNSDAMVEIVDGPFHNLSDGRTWYHARVLNSDMNGYVSLWGLDSKIVRPQIMIEQLRSGLVYVSGCTTPNIMVFVFEDGQIIHETESDNQGHFSCKLELQRGEHEIQVKAADSGSGQVLWSDIAYVQPQIHTVIGSTYYTVNSEEILQEVPVTLRSPQGTTMAMVEVLEELGVDVSYGFVERSQQIELSHEGFRYATSVGSNVLHIFTGDDYHQEVELYTSAVYKNRHVYVPIREICNYLGFEVNWDNRDNSLNVTK